MATEAPDPTDEFVVAWPTLGFLVADWVERHCIIPDGFRKGRPFVMYEWQLWCTVNHYRVKPDALPAGDEYVNAEGEIAFVSGAQAFHYRRSLVIAPQKAGKGPWSATIVAAEGVGPVLFDGWAVDGDVYRCSEHGCGCGWERPYEPGDPKGKLQPTPLIQLVATAEKQVDNVYRPLKAMALGERLAPLMQVTEGFIRLPNSGAIEIVTSSAQSKLGNPIIFALQDESGLYTETNGMVEVAKTMRRGAAGMGGRSMETSNAFDPTMGSTAQTTYAAAGMIGDIFVFWQQPPDGLGDYAEIRNRRRIHAYAYRGCAHIDLDVIESEALELLLNDPRNAERFFGNRAVAGSAKWMTPEEWDALADTSIGTRTDDGCTELPKGERIAIGFDGSDGTSATKRVADSTVIRGCRLSDGFRFTIGYWEHENLDEPWFVPRDEVMDRIRWAFNRYDVVLFGFDPPYWRSEMAVITEEFGEDRCIEFRTGTDRLMAGALERVKLAATPHDGCQVVRKHVLNAVTKVKEFRDDNNQRKSFTLIEKASKDSPDKIDGAISDAIAFDMRDRAIAAGARNAPQKFRAITFR